MEDLTFGEQVKIILGRKRNDDQRTGRDDRKRDRKEDVPSESDAAAWKR